MDHHDLLENLGKEDEIRHWPVVIVIEGEFLQ